MTNPQTKLSKELNSLKNVLHHRGYPIDKYKNHSSLLPLQPTEPRDPKFTTLFEELYRQSVGGQTKAAAEELKRHWVYFLIGLSGSAVTHKWLSVPLTKSAYSKDRSWLRKLNLKYNATTRIVKFLKEEKLAVVLEGAPYKKEAWLTRIYPRPDFAALILPFYLSSHESFHGNYLEVSTADREPMDTIAWAKKIRSVYEDHPDKAYLEGINDFLKEQQWACRGPIILKYKNTTFHGSRLYTRYQQLPNKHYKIRINTLINNEPIYEMKFNANYLRLAMAVRHKQDIGDNPYEDIMWLADIQDRDLVKSFITIAMAARNRDQAHSRWNLNSSGTENFGKIESAVNKRFPDLKLYDDWSVQAQNLERAILRDVVLAGIKKDIVVLPIHDAVAVQQRHENWVVDAMLESWSKHVDHGEARLKIERP